ncbi:MAG: low molecular weight protein-tyrosine-phosphatase [Pseudomonadota bacterium]|nr:low molecular weight protein-tyrosine-phosphatase [Pseudomonadota bacterium]
MKSVLFVCTGNICRSPSADGILRHLAQAKGLDLKIDSCGTHGYHIGEPPDHRSIETARAKGVDISALRARKIAPQDFEAFDILFAMDQGHMRILEQHCPPEYRHKLQMFLSDESDVPDPYYGSQKDFEHVFALCYKACQDILESEF